MWIPSLFFISGSFYRMQYNFGPLNDHMITEFSWVVTMVTGHAQHCHLLVTCPVTVTTANTVVIVCYLTYQITQNWFLGLCIIDESWKRHNSHTRARFGCNCVCHVIYLPISPQERPRYELSYRCNLQQPVEFEIVLTEKWLRTKPASRTFPLLQLVWVDYWTTRGPANTSVTRNRLIFEKSPINCPNPLDVWQNLLHKCLNVWT